MKLKNYWIRYDGNGEYSRIEITITAHFKRNKGETICHLYKVDGAINKIMTPHIWKASYFAKDGHGECEWDWITKLPSATTEETAELLAYMKSCGYEQI